MPSFRTLLHWQRAAQVQQPWQASSLASVHAWAQAEQGGAAAAAEGTSAAAAGADEGAVAAAAVDKGSGWGPDWPGGACPPSCVDLSVFK